MSQVKRLRELGFEFEDSRMWDVLEVLDNLPAYLEEKRKKREERARFVDFVFRDACEKAGLI